MLNENVVTGVKFSEFTSVQAADMGNSDEVVGLHEGDNARITIANLILKLRQGLGDIYVTLTQKGAADGVAELDENGKVPSTQLDLSSKQDKITANGILKGNGAGGVSAATPGTDYGTYSKPSGGIPSSDMASGVQTSLGKADTAYQKPSGGIPASDLASGVIPTVPSASSTNPLEDGTVSPGSSSDYARGDHVHPHDSIKANHAEFADLESGSTASRAYGIGEYFTQKTSGRLLRVIVPISAGGTFTPGTNCEYTTVGSELQDKPKNMVFTLTAGKTLTITKTAGALYSYLISGAGPAAFGSLWWVMGYSNTGTQTKLVTLSTANNLVITNGATSITIQNTHPSNGARVTVLVLGYEGTLPTYTVS